MAPGPWPLLCTSTALEVLLVGAKAFQRAIASRGVARIRLAARITGEAEDLDVLLGAVEPEREDEHPGVELAIERPAPEAVVLTLAGDRAPQVRAAMNAYVRWAMTVEEVLDGVPPRSQEVP